VTIEVEIGGRLHRVELERDGQRWVATVGGRRVYVDAVRVGDGWSLLIDEAGRTSPLPRSPEKRSRGASDVTLESRPAGEWVVYVNGQVIPTRVIDPRAWRRGDRQDSSAARGSRTLTSAMPGRVVKVLVKPGDRVTERQPLVVVEAMKMENELRAPGDAVVREVKVAEGASVEAGAILMVLE
jgi:biotin carboxyl carrier protein